ncbi:MAG: hypothetical protein R2843_13890 [Thermomicrobiales bacterium]
MPVPGDPDSKNCATSRGGTQQGGPSHRSLGTERRAGAHLASRSPGGQYLEARKPWTLAKDEANAGLLDTTLYTAAEATRFAGLLLAPFMAAPPADHEPARTRSGARRRMGA